MDPAPSLAQRSDKERIIPAKNISPWSFSFNGGKGNNPNIQFPVSSSRYTFKSENLGISGRVSFLLEKQTKIVVFWPRSPSCSFLPSLCFSLFFFFSPSVQGLFLSSSARRTRCVNMVPAGCLECERRGRLAGWERGSRSRGQREDSAPLLLARPNLPSRAQELVRAGSFHFAFASPLPLSSACVKQLVGFISGGRGI